MILEIKVRLLSLSLNLKLYSNSKPTEEYITGCSYFATDGDAGGELVITEIG